MKKLISIILMLVMLFAVALAEESAPNMPAISVGDIVTFGSYEQDNNSDNGPEPIEWIVLDVQDGKALLLSRYGLDARPYNTAEMDITWENCTLRTWLNDDFLNAAFSETEQQAILLTEVDNSDAQGFDWPTVGGDRTTGGNNTQDMVFLLSCAEAGKYLGVQWVQSYGEEGANQNLKSRVAPTAYAIAKGAFAWDHYLTEDGKQTGVWWLRSPGYDQDDAANVDSGGSLRNSLVGDDYGVVRPAFWLNLESDTATMELVAKVSNETLAEQAAEPTAVPLSNKLVSTPFSTVGSIVTFGYYEQDNNPDNGPEPIEWIVLDVQDGEALLLSKYGLDTKPYDNTEKVKVTWENCTLRTWLNDDFLNAAFSETEQQAILLMEVDNSDAQGFDWTMGGGVRTTGGNNTQDYLFLLSYADANKYLVGQNLIIDIAVQNVMSRVAPTAYAIVNGAYTENDCLTADGEMAGLWWLRSPGSFPNRATIVEVEGALTNIAVNVDFVVVRPALWVNLNSGIF